MDKGIALVAVIDQVVQYGDEPVRIHPDFLQLGVEGILITLYEFVLPGTTFEMSGVLRTNASVYHLASPPSSPSGLFRVSVA